MKNSTTRPAARHSTATTPGHSINGRKVILVQKPTRWNIPALRLLSASGFDVIYMFYPDHLKTPDATRATIEGKLEALGLRKFDFSEGRGSDTYGYAIHSPAYARRIHEDLFDGIDLTRVAPLFQDVPDALNKLPILFYDQIVREAINVGDFISVAQALEESGHRVFLFHPSRALQQRIFSRDISGFRNFYPWSLSVLFLAFGKGIQVIARLLARFAPGRKKTPSALNEMPSPPSRPVGECPPVAYFPYKGVAYNNLYTKEQYYDANPASPFHQKRILHIERQDEWNDVAEISRNYYRDHDLNLMVLEMGLSLNRTNLIRLTHAFREVWAGAAGAGRFTDRILATSIMMRAYLLFLRGRDNVTALDGVKIALVGYDYLFSPALSMALQARGIKVVAIQERLILTFHRSFAPVFDTYFVSGRRVSDNLRQRKRCWLGEMPAIGLVRAERLKQHRAENTPVTLSKANDPEKLVVVLDFLSIPDPLSDSDCTMICWEANRAFYEDILHLAENHPEAHFVIRGKNDNWCNIPYFSDTVRAIDATPNVEINHEYDEVYVSYKLIAKAKLVICRPSSLGDEAMSVGIPVLYHDATPMRSRNVANVYDYDGFPVYVHSRGELAKRTREILDEGTFADEQEYAHMREYLYTASNDHPRQTMLDYLHSMLGGATPN